MDRDNALFGRSELKDERRSRPARPRKLPRVSTNHRRGEDRDINRRTNRKEGEIDGANRSAAQRSGDGRNEVKSTVGKRLSAGQPEGKARRESPKGKPEGTARRESPKGGAKRSQTRMTPAVWGERVQSSLLPDSALVVFVAAICAKRREKHIKRALSGVSSKCCMRCG
jgi:hypothetical protein